MSEFFLLACVWDYPLLHAVLDCSCCCMKFHCMNLLVGGHLDRWHFWAVTNSAALNNQSLVFCAHTYVLLLGIYLGVKSLGLRGMRTFGFAKLATPPVAVVPNEITLPPAVCQTFTYAISSLTARIFHPFHCSYTPSCVVIS